VQHWRPRQMLEKCGQSSDSTYAEKHISICSIHSYFMKGKTTTNNLGHAAIFFETFKSKFRRIVFLNPPVVLFRTFVSSSPARPPARPPLSSSSHDRRWCCRCPARPTRIRRRAKLRCALVARIRDASSKWSEKREESNHCFVCRKSFVSGVTKATWARVE
jgi:hypothetical protein